MSTIPTISSGYLNKSAALLLHLKQEGAMDENELKSILEEDDIIIRDSVEVVLNLVIGSEWLVRNEQGRYEVNKSIEVEYKTEIRTLQLELLWLYIRRWSPSWIQSLSKGPKSARSRLDSIDIKQIFEELGLLVDVRMMDIHAKKWWSRMKSLQYALIQEKNAETGMAGEELSMKYEYKRTGKMPVQVSLESDSYGYDISSVFSKKKKKKLRIEVKTSRDSWEIARLHLTRNEFGTSRKHTDSYIFHLWDISEDTPLLLKVKVSEVVKHCPEDSGDGVWESVRIEFSVFDWQNAERFE